MGSLIYFFTSKLIGGDVLNRIGYKNGICLGLVISALGSLLFYPAANSGSYGLMLSGLFIVGLGFSLQQIAANPLAIVMGNPATGAQRLTLAGGINNLGTTIGPLLVSIAIFGSVAAGGTEASIESVKVPYLILGAAFILVAIFLKFSSVPNQINLDDVAADEAEDASKLVHKKSAFAYPQLVLGMIAIFVYVGVEVSTISNLPAYLELPVSEGGLGIETALIAPFVSLYWASLMIGRWAGAAGAFEVKMSTKWMLTILLPYLAFGVFLAVNAIANHEISHFFLYAFVIVLMIVATFASRGNPARMLLYFAMCGIVALLIGMFTSGMTSVVAFISVGPVLQHDVAVHLRPGNHRTGQEHQPGQQPADHDDHGWWHRQLAAGRAGRQHRHPLQLHRRRAVLRLPRLLRDAALARAAEAGHRPGCADRAGRPLIPRRAHRRRSA